MTQVGIRSTSKWIFIFCVIICGLTSLAIAQDRVQTRDSSATPGMRAMRVDTGLAAITVTVDTTADTIDANLADGLCADVNGNCSLRAAIMQANMVDAGSVITVPEGIYILSIPRNTEANDFSTSLASEGDLDLLREMTIKGAGANKTIINANQQDSVFEISWPGELVTIQALTATNGNRPENGSAGGAIHLTNAGILYLDGVILKNSIAGYGGGINADAAASLTMHNSAIISNRARRTSGGLDVYSGTTVVNLMNVTISDNRAQGLDVASRSGGIEVWNGGMLNANNITVADNTADTGGGLNAPPETLSGEETGIVNLSNSIIALNSAKTSPDCAGDIVSAGNNLFSDDTGCSVEIGDIVSGTPGLDTLMVLEPGTTPTHRLLSISPAVDAAMTATCEINDQRGIERPQGNGCDIGAFERTPDVSRELLVNGSFERDDAEPFKVPDGWTAKNLSRDKLVSNKVKDDGTLKIVAADGESAFRFKGLPGFKSAKIKQTTDIEGVSIGDTLTLQGYMRGKNLSGIAAIKFKVKYEEEAIKPSKFTLRPPQGTSEYASFEESVIVAGTVTKIKVLARMMGTDTTGKFYVDGLSLTHVQVSGLEGLLPLPPAPVD